MDTVHGASVRLRHLLFELETPVLDATLTDGLRDAAAQIFEDSAVGWTVEERGRAPLPQRARVSAYRIAREAMVNARKHAEADTVSITVDATARGVEVHVVDDGRGMADTTSAPSGRRHSGVVGMRDRALASGGWWRSEPGPGGVGTAVSFFLPVTGAEDTGDPLVGEHATEDVGGTGHADDEVSLHAPAQQHRQIPGDGALQQVGRTSGGQDAQPRRGIRVR
jgi:nitrate/nitrite-specific signal transduction histidine kinase